MSTPTPASIYGLTLHPNESPKPPFDFDDFPATFRITMAAIDPTAKPSTSEQVNGDAPARATLKMIRIPVDYDSEEDDSEDEDDDEDYNMADLLDEDSESISDDEELNGGPSDPTKSPKARQRAMIENFKQAVRDGKDDAEGDETNGTVKAKDKGKGKAIDEESDESDDDLIIPEDAEELILCTLDPTKHYQQPLDITIPEHENVLFQVTGNFTVYLTGNIMMPSEDSMFGSDISLPDSEDDEENEVYDLEPDEDELEIEFPDDEDESDELDDIADPRIEELDSDDDGEDASPPPKLVMNGKLNGKGKNKRAAEDSAENTPEKSSVKPGSKTEPLINGDQHLSKAALKKQRKKLKDNAGNAVEVVAGKEENKANGIKEDTEVSVKASPNGKDKKVSFAKTLVQGPSNSSPSMVSSDSAKNSSTSAQNKKTEDGKSTKPSLGVKHVQGVEIDDKKLGQGQQAKKGDKVSMRYIGKLEETKRVFDANKKGEPFSFKLGSGQVIKGMDIGTVGMSIGGERRIIIPANLAYGNKKEGDIPANSKLIFDIKLLAINTK